MTSSSSVTAFVVEDRLPWPDEGSRAAQTGVLEPGVIYDGARHPCTIRRISSRGATVTAKLNQPTGARVSVEIGTGQRPTGTIAWVDRGEAGIAFDRPIDVLALINRSLVNQPVERRRMPRIELRCSVHLRFGAVIEPATLRNISASGLQVEGDRLPPIGTFVSPLIEWLAVPAGEILWREGRLAGIELLEELSWTSLMPWVRQKVRNGA